MRLPSKPMALAALLALSVAVAGQSAPSAVYHEIALDESEATGTKPAPKPDPGAEARKRLELERAKALEQREAARATRVLATFTAPRLTRFANDQHFARYIEAVEDAETYAQSSRPGVKFAQAQTQPGLAQDATEPICPPDEPDCLAGDDAGNIVVTGSRISPSNPSITNNQLAGVEEGDIVKQIGHHLLILKDGRIFVADIRAGGRHGLALVERMNVYRDPESDTWYDEMLVIGDRVIVTGYSYEDRASEIAVFRMAPTGRLANEGVFHMSSNDYFSADNYATRLIGDRLVVYTPFEVSEIDAYDNAVEWPVIRRWLPAEDRNDARRRGTPRFAARDIYQPVRGAKQPTVHAISVCPLGQVTGARDLGCRTTAFVGPSNAEWYVDETDAYLWTSEEESGDGYCGPGRPALARATPALLHRIPHGGRAVGVAATGGLPNDQFSFEVSGGRLHALLRLQATDCYPRRDAAAQLAFLRFPLARLGPVLRETPVSHYAALPSTGTRYIANRFTDRYLVYGGLSSYRSGLPVVEPDAYEDDPEGLASLRLRMAMPPAFVVPIASAGAARRLDVRQTVVRAERVGNDILLSGYRNREGLRLTYLDLSGTPRVASSLELPGRYESEGRSHAFNSSVGPGGDGLLGLPTVPTVTQSGRWWWRSRASDLSYVRLDRRGRMAALGELRARFGTQDDDDGNPAYDCEVSCIDWYGNSRPIFTGGRVFALSGTELIEGSVSGRRIVELSRLDLTGPPRPQSTGSPAQ